MKPTETDKVLEAIMEELSDEIVGAWKDEHVYAFKVAIDIVRKYLSNKE